MTPWTVPPSGGFFRQECWNGLPFPSPEDLPDPGLKPASPALGGEFFTTEPPGKPRKLLNAANLLPLVLQNLEAEKDCKDGLV